MPAQAANINTLLSQCPIFASGYFPRCEKRVPGSATVQGTCPTYKVLISQLPALSHSAPSQRDESEDLQTMTRRMT